MGCSFNQLRYSIPLTDFSLSDRNSHVCLQQPQNHLFLLLYMDIFLVFVKECDIFVAISTCWMTFILVIGSVPQFSILRYCSTFCHWRQWCDNKQRRRAKVTVLIQKANEMLERIEKLWLNDLENFLKILWCKKELLCSRIWYKMCEYSFFFFSCKDLWYDSDTLCIHRYVYVWQFVLFFVFFCFCQNEPVVATCQAI